MSPLGFALPLLLAMLLLPAAALGPAGAWLVPAVVFLLVPLLDALLGEDRRELPGGWRAWCDALLVLWLPAQALVLAVAAVRAAAAPTFAEAAGWAVSCGILTGGIGITVAHELGHRGGRLAGLAAGSLLASVGYLHFQVEHYRGHHARVATPDDPASARRGEGLPRFLLRTLGGSLASAWRLERERLARAPAAAAWRNLVLVNALGIAALMAAFGAWLGWRGVAFWLGQALVAVLLLETVNYIEHYGLRRRRLASGGYEPVGERHAWNSCHRLSNWLLFNLQRHSHHHVNARRHFAGLRDAPAAPRLPAGYPAMVLLACCPPLWRRVMHRRLPPA